MQSFPKFKRKNDSKPVSSEPTGFEKTVADHYNKRPKVQLAQRTKSEIFTLRALNNWIKAVLIKESAKWIVGDSEFSGLRVLDFAGGKGGDLNKWAQNDVRDYLCVDIASESIAEGRQRYDKRSNSFPFKARFIVADCFNVGYNDWMPPKEPLFDVISCQFALHYAFSTRENARTAIGNVSSMLRPGGVFICTIPNSNRIVKRLREASALKSFGNKFYNIKAEAGDPFELFGHAYTFHLNDAIDSLPEYLVHIPTFQKLAGDAGLELVYLREFPEVVDEYFHVPEYAQLMLRNKVVTKFQPFVSPEEWEISSLYLALCFRKTAAL